MKIPIFAICLTALGLWKASADSLVDPIAGKKVVFLGDSITQAGTYIGFTSYYLQRLYPEKNFDFYSLGLSSETVSGLSEEGHAGGRFPRPVVFERLGRILEKVQPEVVFACYGINCGIDRPLDESRLKAFQTGIQKLIRDCQKAGVSQIFLITPPIYDATIPNGEFHYDEVMSTYAAWEMDLKIEGVQAIDLHPAMRKARDQRTEPFSKDRVHPGKEGHLVMTRTILTSLGASIPDDGLSQIEEDPLYQKIETLRAFRSREWMKHIGYTREKTVEPTDLGTTPKIVADSQIEIDRLRRKP